jgi:hypothetical protein
MQGPEEMWITCGQSLPQEGLKAIVSGEKMETYSIANRARILLLCDGESRR